MASDGFLNGIFGSTNVPGQGRNPQAQNYGDLIQQLKMEAAGRGNSVSQNAYEQANADGLAQQVSMSRGGSAAGARQGANNAMAMSGALAHGYAGARMKEQAGAQGQLVHAIGGAANIYNQDQDRLLRAWQMQQAADGQKMSMLGGGLATAGTMFGSSDNNGANENAAAASHAQYGPTGYGSQGAITNPVLDQDPSMMTQDPNANLFGQYRRNY